MSDVIIEDTQDVIDIAECRRAVEMDRTVTVMLTEKQGFELRIDIRKQERLIKKYVDPQVYFDNHVFDQAMLKVARLQKEQKAITDEAVQGELESVEGMITMGGKGDYYGLGLALVDYVEDWIGFKGRYNKQDAMWYLEHFPDSAKALGRNFRPILTEYQKAHTVYAEALEKN